MNNKPKILVVDDKPENLFAIEKVLKDLDIELIKAESGNEALKATLHHDFALALLDIQMPEMDGYELASILREEEKTCHLPFIFISAVYTDNLNVFKGYEKGAFSFITKPFQAEILINKVKFFMEKHQQEIELQNKNHELMLINKELEAFSYTVSHDLRAPLRALNGYSKILQEDFSGVLSEEGMKLLSEIGSNAVRMANLIDNLLAFSRLGRKELRKSKINMEQLVNEVLYRINQSFPNKAEIEIDTLSDVNGDQELIHQVWFNLISNAVKYSAKKEAPFIKIDSAVSDGEIIYCVKDNGVGFDMKYANKLFGVFERLHHVSDFEGTGIGLAIINRIITKHNGRVWFEAEENKGAIFCFSLPLA